jgi:hypothetical protein
MWRGYETALAYYGSVICLEWIERGYNDTQLEWFRDRIGNNQVTLPPWLGDEDFHTSHKSNLLRKDFDHYSQFWSDIPNDLEYVWPVDMLVLA